MTDRGLFELLRTLRSDVDSLTRRLARGTYSLPARLSPAGAEVTDWDDAIAAGFYWSESGAANEPVAFDLVGTVETFLDGSLVQILHRPDSTTPDIIASEWRRRRSDVGAWTAWVQVGPGAPGTPFAMAAGTVATPGAGSSSPPVWWDNAVTVTFPVGRFSVAPIVTASGNIGATGGVSVGVGASALTSAGVTLRQTRIGSAPSAGFVAHWIAVQMTSGSAAG